jgi:hypothetical protein
VRWAGLKSVGFLGKPRQSPKDQDLQLRISAGYFFKLTLSHLSNPPNRTESWTTMYLPAASSGSSIGCVAGTHLTAYRVTVTPHTAHRLSIYTQPFQQRDLASIVFRRRPTQCPGKSPSSNSKQMSPSCRPAEQTIQASFDANSQSPRLLPNCFWAVQRLSSCSVQRQANC